MKNVINIEQNAYQPTYRALHQRCTEGSGLLYAIFFTLRESRRAPNPSLARVRSKLLRLHPRRRTLGGALRLLQQWD